MLAPLLVLTDRHQLPPGHDLVETVARCAEAGLDTVVLRELDLSEPERADLAEALAAHVRVVSARTRLPGARGIHLHATQNVHDARGMELHGRSCHTLDEVRRAVDGGADYVTVGPVASSASKPGHGPPLAPEQVRRAASAASGTPVFALGGVDTNNAAEVRAAGVHGVAVMGAVMRADDPAAAVAALLAELQSYPSDRPAQES
ncbi:MAG: thiamine phosphate synthase [Nocardioides sp.]|nr:thiamine phosphate synthase [Nocardioides sp.]